ncbi:hypothetical protein BDW67DRAFT_152095 [Aspergillus spinulosporus]
MQPNLTRTNTMVSTAPSVMFVACYLFPTFLSAFISTYLRRYSQRSATHTVSRSLSRARFSIPSLMALMLLPLDEDLGFEKTLFLDNVRIKVQWQSAFDINATICSDAEQS